MPNVQLTCHEDDGAQVVNTSEFQNDPFSSESRALLFSEDFESICGPVKFLWPVVTQVSALMSPMTPMAADV